MKEDSPRDAVQGTSYVYDFNQDRAGARSHAGADGKHPVIRVLVEEDGKPVYDCTFDGFSYEENRDVHPEMNPDGTVAKLVPSPDVQLRLHAWARLKPLPE